MQENLFYGNYKTDGEMVIYTLTEKYYTPYGTK